MIFNIRHIVIFTFNPYPAVGGLRRSRQRSDDPHLNTFQPLSSSRWIATRRADLAYKSGVCLSTLIQQ